MPRQEFPWDRTYEGKAPDDWSPEPEWGKLTPVQMKWLAAYAETYDEEFAREQIGVVRQTVWRWKRNSRPFLGAIEWINSQVVPMLVGKLIGKAMRGDVKACKYLLENLAPDRFGRHAVLSAMADSDAARFAPAEFFNNQEWIGPEDLEGLPPAREASDGSE